MTKQRFSDPAPIPEGLRLITWEIGDAELQKSLMAIETFEALWGGQTNVERIRNKIHEKTTVASRAAAIYILDI
ncbi:MAG TPA: hypothetical protein VKA12_08245 [Roseiarcus sp.]|nr:hypothetical protein [Roseiarcus sp.]